MLATCDLPPFIRKFISSARLVMLDKSALLEDGLPDVRPIAIGETLRRLVGKLLLEKIKPRASELLADSGQFGIGIPCASEIIIPSTRHLLELNKDC